MEAGSVISRFVWGVMDANSWLVIENGYGLLFDAVDSPTLYKAIEGLDELVVILTHCHFDHICGLNHIRTAMRNLVVISTEACSDQIQKPGQNLSNIANAIMAFHDPGRGAEGRVEPFSCEAADRAFNDNMKIDWHGHSLLLSEYNGHSKGGLCCVMDGLYLFSGDTLLHNETVTRLPGGNTRLFLAEDMPRLRAMKGTIECVYPGHGVPGRLEEMLLHNENG